MANLANYARINNIDNNIKSLDILNNTITTTPKLALKGDTLVSTEINTDIKIIPDGGGQVKIKSDPVSDLGVATKQYVDNTVGNVSNMLAKIHANYRSNIVSIYVQDNKAHWSGILLSNEGYIVTTAEALIFAGNDGVQYYNNIYIIISIENVNKITTCDIVGYDGAGNIGVLKIANNEILQDLKTLNTLEWSDNNYNVGDQCFILGNLHGVTIVNNSVIKNINYMTGGYNLSITRVSTVYFESLLGSVILDQAGRIISICNSKLYADDSLKTSNEIGGPNMIKNIVTKIIETKENYAKFRGNMGIITRPMLIVDYINIFKGVNNNSNTSEIGGEIITNVDMQGPCANILDLNDILLQVNDMKCGILTNQNSHTSAYWSQPPGVNLTIKYKKANENYSTLHTNIITTNSANANDDMSFYSFT